MCLRTLSRALLLFICIVSFKGQANAENEKLNLLDLTRLDAEIMMGTWEHNILDAAQSVRHEISANAAEVDVLFDVDSSLPAMGGFWLKIEGHDLSEYESLHLWMRAESDPPFTGNIALQFTDKDNRKAPYLLSGVRSEWKEFEVPLQKFRRIRDWSEVKTFEIVIDDIHARPKKGVLFLKEVSVVKGGTLS